VTVRDYSVLIINYPGQLSLVICLWVGAKYSAAHGYRQERNGEFCETVDPLIRTAIIRRSIGS